MLDDPSATALYTRELGGDCTSDADSTAAVAKAVEGEEGEATGLLLPAAILAEARAAAAANAPGPRGFGVAWLDASARTFGCDRGC